MSNLINELKDGFESRSVLIIDDDIEVAASLSKILKTFFKECVIANDGEEGFNKFQTRLKSNNPFTLVITDLELPKMGGLRIIREIKAISKEQPVLIISAHDDAEFMTEAIRLEVNGYLIKPLSMPKLFENLNKILSNKKASNKVSSVEIDEVTGWGKNIELTNRLSSSEDASTTILYIRINHLASMFNIVGKAFTNEYLSELAKLLESLLLESDGEFYRVSTDEICLVLDGNQLEYAYSLAKNMLSVVRYFHTSEQGIILNSTLSIGIAQGTENTLINSKLALSKNNDQLGSVTVFSSDNNQEQYTLNDSYDILKIIHNAVTEENIIPFLQPVADINTGEFKIYQSLMRIRDNNQLYGPETFLQLAMDMGQMPMITRSMIKNTFKLASKLPEGSIISICLSSYDLNDEGLPSYIDFWAERHNLLSTNIAFQISNEDGTLENKLILEVVKSLQKKGYKIIVENFGFSQCNLLNLLEFNPDYIKLKLDIIQKTQDNPRKAAIVRQLVEIAHAIGSKVILSHVTNMGQTKLEHFSNVDLIQGFIVSAPYEVTNE